MLTLKAKRQLENISGDTIPYTYYIAWVNEYGSVAKCYYGVKYAKGCHPSNFWKTYKTSSRLVKEMIAVYGDPQIIEVRNVFKSKQEACLAEFKVLSRMNIPKNYDVWLNRNLAGAVVLTKDVIERQASKIRGIPKTAEHRKKIGDAQRGKVISKESIEKCKETKRARRHTYVFVSPNKGKPGTMLGKHHSPETRAKMSISQKNKPPISDETRAKMSFASANVKHVECPNCKRSFKPNCLGNHKKYCLVST